MAGGIAILLSISMVLASCVSWNLWFISNSSSVWVLKLIVSPYLHKMAHKCRGSREP